MKLRTVRGGGVQSEAKWSGQSGAKWSGQSEAMMGMGRWNSKGCQTRVKWFKVRRQKEEISLAASRPREPQKSRQRHRREENKINERRYSEKLFN
ncbi:hypothetical protein AVEN_183574-1 [Araneus ventricosus]|uniref:Uncharacterized protein n=1 Tax=Araneus ventricosus TaxID=182803 RepID=A0A4Y2H0Y3_ARAVE|nr:hypothetical protein AVEN_183574-1 [Araneus ventricosus]